MRGVVDGQRESGNGIVRLMAGTMGLGPVALPPDVCAIAKSGWRILLTAVRVEGRWLLLEVVNGDP